MAATSSSVLTLSRGPVDIWAPPLAKLGFNPRFIKSPYVFCLGAQESEPICRSVGDPGRRPHRCIAPILDVRAHDLDAVGESHLRRPAELGTNLGDICP